MSRFRRADRRGVTLVEVLVSAFLLAGIVVAVMAALRDQRDGQLETADVVRAHQLAEALMAEILRQNYEEPLETVEFGPETSEPTIPVSRLNFDDVDDYKDWNKNWDEADGLPVQRKDGTLLSLGPGWAREADVEFAKENDLAAKNDNQTGIKRVVVTVYRDEQQLASSVGYMTRYWQAPPYD